MTAARKEAPSKPILGKPAAGGKVIGLALLHQETVPSMRLSPALRKLLLSNALWAHDMISSPEDTHGTDVLPQV